MLHVAQKLAGSDAEQFADQATTWIQNNLGNNYAWRGNTRELEQCVSSILIRGEYAPNNAGKARNPADWLAEIASGDLTVDEVLNRYCTFTYFKTNSYEAASRKLGIDRRTVKSRVDQKMLASLRKQNE